MKVSGPQLIILSNSKSIDYFSSHEKKIKSNLSSNINSGPKDISFEIISDREEFEEFIGQDYSKADPLFFLISVETNWNNSRYEGYNIALELMEHPNLKDKKIDLYFTSFLERLALYQECENRLKMLPKSFQHFQLPYQKDSIPELKPMLSSKWNFIKNLSLTESGILDKLKHDLAPYLSSPEDLTKEKSREFVEHIRAIPEIVGDDLLDYVNTVGVQGFSKNRYKIQEKISERIEWLKPVRINPSGNDSAWTPHMLIIEDNEKFQQKLKRIFGDHFELEVKSSGEEAIDYIDKESFLIDVIVSDLELLNESGLDQPVQGIDVIAHVKSKYPEIVLRVITHLPRSGVRELLNPLDIKYKDLVYKKLLDPLNDAFLEDLILLIKREVDKSSYYKHLKGPDNTLWTHSTPRESRAKPGRVKWFYYKFKSEEPEEFERMWNSIDDKISRILNGDERLSHGFGTMGDWKKIFQRKKPDAIEFLQKLLIDRLFWIRKYYVGTQQRTIQIDEVEKFFKHNRWPFNRKNDKRFSHYGGLTGFQFTKDSGNYLTLTFGQLFNEELARLNTSLDDLDLANAYLTENTIDILEYVNGQGHMGFDKDYTSAQTFADLWMDDSLELNHIHKVLRQLKNEKPTIDFMDAVRAYNRRKEVLNELQSLMDKENKEEYNLYDRDTKKLISEAYQTLNWEEVEE